MFRNPRQTSSAGGVLTAPSIGRPPTPPSEPNSVSMASVAAKAPIKTSTPPLRGTTKISLAASNSTRSGRSGAKANASILSFFKRASETKENDPTASEEESLFLESSPIKPHDVPVQVRSPESQPLEEADYTSRGAQDPTASRFNEFHTPSKRRRIEEASMSDNESSLHHEAAIAKGPFLDESDDEADTSVTLPFNPPEAAEHKDGDDDVLQPAQPTTSEQKSQIPSFKRENTSVGGMDDFDGLDDFIDDEFFDEGEEYMERKWMEEQAEIEAGVVEELEMNGDDELREDGDRDPEKDMREPPEAEDRPSCPICGGSTASMSEQQTSAHVNDCLDGKAKPLPSVRSLVEEKSSIQEPTVNNNPQYPKRLYKAAIARPGQQNPFSLTSNKPTSSSSAFSKLMSGHAEDTAWAAAASSEASSRGKPAYQRTCPFYKIMPGLYICVDAFRYGAVQGCNAYFLSHFHSDHYIGLTSSWCHGPIYCSRVTGNLVRRQLRVDPKWVVDLEFEKKVEVPNTQGVGVTMIPANHCPGSSLFLFEKTVGKGKDPKVQRILHCGDFRACPAHVQHPKLRPDILDTTTGRSVAKQKIDVCYLDTTYLTPKYAFPSQEEVIRACSDMCVSLSKDFVDETDSWEKTKQERAGAGMVKFVRKASVKDGEEAENVKQETNEVKAEDADESQTPVKKTRRGRLLVVVGTYSIGKERICLGVAKALNSKIYAPPNKQKIVAALEDKELSARMTSDPLEAQVHMQMLMEIRAETLADYLTGYKPHFSRVVGFRPSGWNYRPPSGRFTESPAVQTVLHSDNWKSKYSMVELVPQRGSTREANCFGVPYSEHSSFRELTMFCCALRIDKIIPTVNVGSAKSREKMRGWCEKWAAEKKKNGLFRVEESQVAWS